MEREAGMEWATKETHSGHRIGRDSESNVQNSFDEKRNTATPILR